MLKEGMILRNLPEMISAGFRAAKKSEPEQMSIAVEIGALVMQ